MEHLLSVLGPVYNFLLAYQKSIIFEIVFPRALHPRSLQASRPYFAFSVASTSYLLTFIFRINDESLAVVLQHKSAVLPSYSPAHILRNRRTLELN